MRTQTLIGRSFDQHTAIACLALVIVALISLSATAIAGPDDDDDVEDDDLAEAKELYEVGNAHYAAGRYEKAAASFLKGYQLSELPGFLYNLANAYERMGEYRKAAEKLEIYLESPKAKDVVSVRERVKRLRAAAEDQERVERKRKAREEQERKFAADRDRETPGESVAYENGPRSPTFLYFLGGGAAALAAGGTFALLSRSAANDAAAGCIGTLCDRAAQSALDREKSLAVVADISFGVGVALVGVGAYLYLKGPPRRRVKRDDGDEVSVIPSVGAGSFGLTAVGRF